MSKEKLPEGAVKVKFPPLKYESYENALRANLVNANLRHLQGEILTIIDAALDGDKNKAVKDLIKQAFSDKQNWVYALKEAKCLGEDTSFSKNKHLAYAESSPAEWGLVPLRLEESDIRYSFHIVRY